MKSQSKQVILGISIVVTVGLILVACFLRCIIWHRKRSKEQLSRNIQSGVSLPIRVNGVDSSTILSESVIDQSATLATKLNGHSTWWGKHEKDFVSSASGIPRYSYKDLQKATHNFTTLLGQGAFGPVYKAMMPTGETVAVKVLATNSKQGEKEFQTEVSLLGRLHHRNLVNLVGYCVDKGQRMLVYEFMTNGSLANHLYDEKGRTLSWEERVSIAQDVSRGIEYLHDGAIPPVVHRDIKAANILLDHLMRARVPPVMWYWRYTCCVGSFADHPKIESKQLELAIKILDKLPQGLDLTSFDEETTYTIKEPASKRVADFGLSKEEIYDGHKSGLKGTYGYMDPEYMSTSTFTQKSDVYSYGIFLFELITGRNPQQGLLDYINLAAINAEDKSGWDEILDSRLNGKCDSEEFRTIAALAYKCIQKNPRKRPAMREMVQALSKFQKKKVIENLSRASSVVGDGNSEVLERIELQIAQLNKLSNISENHEA